MKGNRELDKLIISYLLKELNSEDEAFVLDQINADERSKKHFEELRNAWKLLAIEQDLKKIDITGEWNNFVQKVAREKQQLIPIKTPVIADEKIPETPAADKRNVVKKIFISIAVAASLLALVVMVWKFSSINERSHPPIAKLNAGSTNISAALRQEKNYTGKQRKLLLQDGSEIVLYDKSEISYNEPFSNNRRDINLKGKADFRVTKDKTKPFTVYSLDLATTALGTRFTVTAFQNEENIIVRLFEGKVVIKSVEGVKAKLDSDYYLLPGQVLVYNHKSSTAKLSNFSVKDAGTRGSYKAGSFSDDLDIVHGQKGSWNMFNNQSLEQVFDQLKLLYNTDIVFSKKEVHNLYFIGTFERSDSLNYILNQIALLNNLKVTIKDNRYVITKK